MRLSTIDHKSPKLKTALIKTAKTTISLAFWLGIWFAAAAHIGQELILPSPGAVLSTLLTLVGEKEFWLTTASSLLNVFGGFAFGVIIGTLLAALTAASSLADTLFSPMLRVVRSTPVASFIILALLWLGRAVVPGFIAALMVIPVVWSSTHTAIKGTDASLLEMAHAYDFGFFRTLRMIYIPSVLPAWKAACITTLGLAWKSGIAAEVLCLPKNAIGSQIYYSKVYLETASLFAWTSIVILLSFLLERIFTYIMKAGADHDGNK